MTRKVYRTAQGKVVDMGALQLQNETVRAVGNMGVNARGDRVDAHNNPIDSRTQQVSRQYQTQISNVTDQPVAAQPESIKHKKVKKVDIPAPPEDFDDDFEKPDTVEAAPPKTEISGLAAAIAKAREITQEPIQHPNTPKSVKRI
jgi:hypothetical protein